MHDVSAKIAAGGRIVLPANFRRELGVEVGDEVLLRFDDGEVRILKRDQAIRRAQAIVRTSHLCPLPKKPAYMSHSTGRPQQPVGASAEKTRNRFRPVDRTIPGAKSNPSTRPASAPRPNGLGPNDLERDLLG